MMGMVLVARDSERLDRFLAKELPQFSRSKLAAWIDAGQVRVDGELARPGLKLKAGASVQLDAPTETPSHDLEPAEISLDVLFEDDQLLVVNKPRGLATHPAATLREPSLVNALLARSHTLSSVGESFRPGIVHRLDKDTTGAIIVAKTDSAHRNLARQIAEKSAARTYVLVAAGRPDNAIFDVDAPIGRDRKLRLKMAIDPFGKPAKTRFSILAAIDGGTLMRADLQTGRTHQIRVHLSSIGYPVLGDRLYAPKRLQSDWPLQLHAWRLRFDHPRTGEPITVEAPAPADFLGADWLREHQDLD